MKRTLKASMQSILDALKVQGWTTSQGLKVNHATKGNVKLWLKPESIHYSQANGSFASARSLHYSTDRIKSISEMPASQIETVLTTGAQYYLSN